MSHNCKHNQYTENERTIERERKRERARGGKSHYTWEMNEERFHRWYLSPIVGCTSTLSTLSERFACLQLKKFGGNFKNIKRTEKNFGSESSTHFSYVRLNAIPKAVCRSKVRQMEKLVFIDSVATVNNTKTTRRNKAKQCTEKTQSQFDGGSQKSLRLDSSSSKLHSLICVWYFVCSAYFKSIIHHHQERRKNTSIEDGIKQRWNRRERKKTVAFGRECSFYSFDSI